MGTHQSMVSFITHNSLEEPAPSSRARCLECWLPRLLWPLVWTHWERKLILILELNTEPRWSQGSDNWKVERLHAFPGPNDRVLSLINTSLRVKFLNTKLRLMLPLKERQKMMMKLLRQRKLKIRMEPGMLLQTVPWILLWILVKPRRLGRKRRKRKIREQWILVLWKKAERKRKRRKRKRIQNK